MDYLSEFEITDDDLKIAYRVLFDEDGEFDSEKKQIIKSFESCQIEASPGSGKTTTLVAKLIILAEKLKRKKYSKGICILTHTNVGIDVIKEKLGSKGDILFKYPNFVGTLQSFIDTYLAIPYFRMKYKKKVELIDNDFVNSYYYNISCKDSQLKYYLKYSRVDIEKIIFDFKNKCFLVPNLKNNNSDNYKKLYARIEKGFLKYGEAIQLASLYLEEYPQIKNFFNERFFLVQVDEMQDTSDEAFEILERLFNKEKTIVQYIGDKNQNILNGNEKWHTASGKTFIESKSKRFGKHIASFLNHIIKDENITILGNSQIKDYKPILIFYSSDDYKEIENENKVFNKFIEIIKEKNLDKLSGKNKVIGRIGAKSKVGITLVSYFNKFSQQSSNKKNLLINQIKKNKEYIPENKKIISFFKRKINYYFKIMNIDKYKDELENNQILFYKIIYDYLINKDKEQMLKNLFDFFKKITSKTLNETEFYDIFSSFVEEDIDKVINIDTYVKDNVKLEIGTVHSVKGETHLATLYLDTYFFKDKKYDISDYLIFENLLFKEKSSEENKSTKNIIFVGASRPKYLLCFACKDISSEINEEQKKELAEYFEIKYV